MFIPSFTLAQSAFKNNETMVPFLQELDKKEQKILKGEEKLYKKAAKENGRMGEVVGKTITTFFAVVYYGYEFKKTGFNFKLFIEEFLIPVSFFFYSGSVFGEYFCTRSPETRRKIEKQRENRLDEKIKNIQEELKKSVSTEETKVSEIYLQLKKVNDFFEEFREKKNTTKHKWFWKT